VNSTALDAEFDVWQVPACPVRIVYSLGVMEELRLAASEAFNRLAYGGLEIGGVLFGVRVAEVVKVLAHRALECDYAFGPSMTLSDNDRARLKDLLAAPQTDGGLTGMQPVGWYQSHTRSGILLSEKDLQVFQQFFPEGWQIALVLRPHGLDPVRAGFFFREADGSVQAATSHHEFVIKGSGKPGTSVTTDSALVQTGLLETRSNRLAPSRASGAHRRRWIWSAAAIAAAVAGIAFWSGTRRDSAGLFLREPDVGGQLRIDWNHNARVIQRSESGAVEIEDGPIKLHDELSPEHLRLGSVTYLRSSGSVLVRLVVRGADQSTFTEVRRFLGPAAVSTVRMDVGAAARPAAERDATDAMAVRREPEPEVQHVEPVKRAANPTPQEARVKSESPPVSPAVSAPPRRQLVLPPNRVSGSAEPLLPAPPLTAASAPVAITPFTPRLPAPAPPPSPGNLSPGDAGPHSGRIIWTGQLGRSGTIQILGDRVSHGHITGGLPGVPVRVQIFPAELIQEGLRIFTADPKSVSAPEAPGVENGWNRTAYVLNPKKAGEVRIVEAPGQQNGWNRLVLRVDREYAIIVLRWERASADSSLYAAGKQ
jgi:proteasome lid subunit RPN8/RPN11